MINFGLFGGLGDGLTDEQTLVVLEMLSRLKTSQKGLQVAINSMGKPGRDLRRSRVDIRRSRLDIRRSRVDIRRSKVKRKILIFLTIRHCQKLKIL